MKNVLLLGIGFLSVMWCTVGKYLYAASRLLFKVSTVRLVPLADSNVQVQVEILVNNPTTTELFIDGIDADIVLNGKQIGYVSTAINRRLYANGVVNILLPITTNIATLGESLYNDMLTSTIQSWNVRLVGTFYAQGQTIPLDIIITTQDIENAYAG